MVTHSLGAALALGMLYWAGSNSLPQTLQLTSPTTSAQTLGCNAAFIAYDGHVCLARNLDILFPDGYWVVNPRGVRKTAYLPTHLEETPARWTATYGSLTINGFHTDIPLGGINETGLVVEHLAVKAKYPPPDPRPALTPFQWMQYFLDTCATVQEALRAEPHVRLTPWVFELMHFVMCDAAGEIAILEYVPGKGGKSERRVYTGEEIPSQLAALGNAAYAEHVQAMAGYQGYGGTRPIPQDREALAAGTLYQFAYGADRVRQFHASPTADVVSYLLDTLGGYTWDRTHLSIVYEPSQGMLHFVSSHNRTRRSIALGELDYAPSHRQALLWHEEPTTDRWVRDLDAVNETLLTHFTTHGGFEGFGRYADELLRYRSSEVALSTGKEGVHAADEQETRPGSYLELRWKQVATQMPDAWYGSDEAKTVAENVLKYQTDIGGWAKNSSYHNDSVKQDEWERIKATGVGATFDNGATLTEMRFLTRVYTMTKDERYRDAFMKAFSYILDAQYPNGGWPQYYPYRKRKSAYSSHITYNDHVMVNVMRFLDDIVNEKPTYAPMQISDEMRLRANESFDRGAECILRTQILVDDQPTVWCAQHDEFTLAPAGARSYELPSFSGGESAGVTMLLMELENPSKEIINAVNGAVRWFEDHRIEGIRVEDVINEDGKKDRIVVEDSTAPAQWARFYDLETGEPFFCDRDGIKKSTLAEIGLNRRAGYRWYTRAPAKVLERYPEWARKLGITPALGRTSTSGASDRR